MVKAEAVTRTHRKQDRKSFVVKILTPNPLGLKILQTLIAESAPVKAFNRGWGGGTPSNHNFPKMKFAQTQRFGLLLQVFFSEDLYPSRPSVITTRPPPFPHPSYPPAQYQPIPTPPTLLL